MISCGPESRHPARCSTASILLGVSCAGGSIPAAIAAPATTKARTQSFHIEAQPLGSALKDFAAQAGIQLLFSEADAEGRATTGLDGAFSAAEALQRLLAGSGLVYEFPTADAAIVRRAGTSPGSTSARTSACISGGAGRFARTPPRAQAQRVTMCGSPLRMRPRPRNSPKSSSQAVPASTSARRKRPATPSQPSTRRGCACRARRASPNR